MANIPSIYGDWGMVNMALFYQHYYALPSGNLTWLLKLTIKKVDLLIENGDFP